MLTFGLLSPNKGIEYVINAMPSILRQHPDVVYIVLGATHPNLIAAEGEVYREKLQRRACELGVADNVIFHNDFVTLEELKEFRPDVLVLIDYPGFNLRFAEAVKRECPETRIVYYISPQVWAWNRGRISGMAKILDLMICVFPVEAPMYEASGLHTVFVGHPLLEALEQDKIPVPREPGLVGFFPGSRDREVRRIFPVMTKAAEIIRREFPEARFEAAAASEAHARRMRAMAGDIAVRTGTAHSLMQRATAGVVCSGTATLEAAFFGLPYCLVYNISRATFVFLKCIFVDSF